MNYNNKKTNTIKPNNMQDNARLYSKMARLSKSFIVVCFSLIFSQSILAQCETINLACNNQVNVSINEDCYAAITADLLLENPPLDDFPDDGVNYVITLQDQYGIPIVPSNQVGHDYVNTIITASIELVPCGISCWGTVLVEDKIGPKIWDCVNGELPEIELDCDDFSNGFMIPEPQLGSVCPEVDVLTFVDDTSSLDCNLDFAMNISRIWKAEDAYGNSTSCAQLIQVRKLDLSEVVMPDDFTETIDQDKDCSIYLDVSPERTGMPTGLHCPNIMYYFSDIDYPQCGFQKKILRDWVVIDWCTGQSISKGQIIRYLDRTPPRVKCNIDTLLVGSDPYLCGAKPVLNPFRVLGFDTLGTFEVLDTCPDVITLSVGFLEAIPNEAQPLDVPYYNIPQDIDGTYKLPEVKDVAWIRYCFEDECGNSTAIPDNEADAGELGFCHYFKIQSDDIHPPTAICEGFTKVPLGADGTVEVPASSFDDSSYDPCGDIAYFEVRREQDSCPGFVDHGSDGWGQSVHFCCQDLGDTITVRLRVFDDEGNFSDCLGLVCVSDPRTPVVNCPAVEVDLDCGDDFRDYDLIGLPTGENGCSSGIKIGAESFDLADYDLECGVGTILRTIQVTDLNDVILEVCDQTIEFDGSLVSTPFEEGDYTFPPTITVDICNSGGSIDPIFTGLPESNKEFGCANIAISYEDDNLFDQNVNGACYTIFRTWTVVNWCYYHPNVTNQHILTGVQEIRVIDSSVPNFQCPDDFTVNANGLACEAQVDLAISVSSTCNSSFDINWEIDAFSDGTIDFVGNGNDASNVYPAGSHTITYKGRNTCGGDEAQCSFVFTVEADRPPLPLCLGNVNWSLGDDGTTEIWASDFDLKSEGGCGLDELTFSFVPPTESNYPVLAQTYTCDDIPNGISNSIQVTIYVVDEKGRFSSCTSLLELLDSKDACQDLGSIANSVSGGITTESKEPLEEVMVELTAMNDEMSMMDMTSVDGSFDFENLSSGGSYSIAPSHDYDHLNGISTLDLVMLQRHILGLSQLDSPYKLIAGDIDKSDNITAIDLIELRKLILGLYDELPDNESWVFVPQSHKFVDPNNPWSFPESIEYYDLETSMESSDFYAVKVGDVNGSVELGTSKSNNAVETSFMTIEERDYQRGELMAVPVVLEKEEDVIGLQFTFKFDSDKLLFEGIDKGSLEVSEQNFALLNDEPGTITFSFSDAETLNVNAGEPLFTIYFETTEATRVSESIKINSSVTKAELYDINANVKEIELVVRESINASTNLEVFQNEPNPFSDMTKIAFYINQFEDVKLEILDASGRMIFNAQGEFEKGLNAFVVRKEDLDSNGLLIYRISSGNASITKKMIMLK